MVYNLLKNGANKNKSIFYNKKAIDITNSNKIKKLLLKN